MSSRSPQNFKNIRINFTYCLQCIKIIKLSQFVDYFWKTYASRPRIWLLSFLITLGILLFNREETCRNREVDINVLVIVSSMKDSWNSAATAASLPIFQHFLSPQNHLPINSICRLTGQWDSDYSSLVTATTRFRFVLPSGWILTAIKRGICFVIEVQQHAAAVAANHLHNLEV